MNHLTILLEMLFPVRTESPSIFARASVLT